jgi:subtilisin-like proprotein convertase family protein
MKQLWTVAAAAAAFAITLTLLPVKAVAAATAVQRLELVRHSLTGAHCRYREYVDGIPSDVYVVRPCDAAALRIATEAQPLRPDTNLRIVDGRVARREIVEERPLERFAYDYDVHTGALIRTVPLFYRAKPARVFDPNPVAATNDVTLQDGNDAAVAVPANAYRDVELLDLVTSGPLAGPNVKLVDRQQPNVAPPDASGSLLFDRAQDGFEDVNVYFHIDRTQRHLQELGYHCPRAVAAYAIEVDAHSSTSDNSFFLPSATRTAEGTLHFGEGGTDDAEDADLIVHEYGHAIQEWIAPGTFGGAFTSQARAMSEGFGDYWAFSAHAAQRAASGRDPFCLADWDARCWLDDTSQQCGYPAGSDCLRRLDSTRTMADYETSGGASVEHRNGTIWSSALREIHQQLGRTVTDTIVVESLFDAPPDPTFAVMAHRMIEADRLLFNGQHAQTICAAMQARGILADCGFAVPRGEQTFYFSSDPSRAIPENDPNGITSTRRVNAPFDIERVAVRVDIVHPVRGDLRIELVAPDGTTILLKDVSGDRGAGIHTTYGVTAAPLQSLDVLRGKSPSGDWKLIVKDLRARDSGRLISWALLLQLDQEPVLEQRPFWTSQMIPVVTHVLGVGGARFVSDVRIANLSPLPSTATLVFTRSGEDGRTNFSAVRVSLDQYQTVGFDDVVESAFATAGSGSLEVFGEFDTQVMSRTYTETPQGTLSQQVPPVTETTAAGEAPLALFPLPDAQSRYNFGITETGGGSGIVRAGNREIAVLPFSHLQFSGNDQFAEVNVVSGDARVAAYVSQINVAGDAMFIPARRLFQDTIRYVAPAIANGPWHTDVWFSSSAMTRVVLDALLTSSFGVIDAELNGNLIDEMVAGVRIRNGATDQYIPFAGPKHYRRNVLFLETVPPYRANIGIFNSFDQPVDAVVTILDSAGNIVQTEHLTTFDRIAQVPVIPGLVHGRAEISFPTDEGHAFVSLIDTRTGDATYIPNQPFP